MKRAKILWFICVFLVFAAGFALGTSHNKPRLMLDARVLDPFLDTQLVPPATTPATKKYKHVKDNFDNYQKKDENIYTEEWKTKLTDGGNPVNVYLVYDVSSETITIVKK
jgi:hypothetical protein